MDIECCEKLLESNSSQLAVKRNTWNLLSLDIQLDVYRSLRAYDLYKKGINVSRQWRNTIERHKRTLPKYRQLTDCRALNKLAGDNYEEYFRRIEAESRRNAEAAEKRRMHRKRIHDIHILTYTTLSITGFIASITAQLGHISAERMITTILLLAIILRMGKTYENLFYYPNYVICCGVSARIFHNRFDKKTLFRYVLLVCLAIRALLLIGIGILRHLIQADNILDIILWSVHIPEIIYLLNWSFNVFIHRLSFPHFGIRSRYKTNIERLKPDYARTVQDILWYSEMPIHTNVCAWALVFSQFPIHLVWKLMLQTVLLITHYVSFVTFLYFWLPNGFTLPASITTFFLFCMFTILEGDLTSETIEQ